MRRKAGDWRCWSCWGEAQRWFHPFNSYGLQSCYVCSLQNGKYPFYQELDWVQGLTATARIPRDYRCSHREASTLVSFSGSVAVPTPVFLTWPLGWTQQHARQKIPIGKTEGVGPKSDSGEVGYGMLKLACQKF